jgi:anti-sigma regulatory factor (Ser/Thr protein kinase)/serine/threonine protein phosphatase PrpC
MKSYECVALNDEAQIGRLRRSARRCASEVGFNERQLAEVDICLKEIGTNAVKFGRGTGQVFFARTDLNLQDDGLEIVYIDKGRGIEDTALALEDGYTTTGSLGAGLGAIKRLADEFHIYSMAQSQTNRLPLYGRTTYGTAIVVRKYVAAASELQGEGRVAVWGAFTRPPSGEESNGDSYVIRQHEDRLVVAVIDGLGHGKGASEASQVAVESIEKNLSNPVEVILRAAHEALRPTRGAVMGLAAMDRKSREIEYAGIGNTDFRLLGGGSALRFISLNGTLGSRLDRVKVFKEQLPKAATIIMATDGISERWDMGSYPGLLGLDPQLICAVILRDFNRAKDDATILCGRLSF